MHALTLLTRGYIHPIETVVQQIPLTPSGGQAILVKALELPLPESLTKALGIHQSDIIIRSAIQVAMADIRANPWQLDYIFASLPQDPVTWKEYGEKCIQEAKHWFVNTNIPVVVYPDIDESQFPAISIKLMTSEEVVPETTLGDVHYQPTETNDSSWPALTSVFTPKSYDVTSGKITLLNAIPNFFVSVGMFILDRVGRAFEITKVDSNDVFYIKANTVADFNNAVIKPKRPAYVVSLESSSFKETYQIGIHMPGEPAKLTWLHSIVVYCLLRYKQALLEARGFERSTFSSSPVDLESPLETEIVVARYMTISGYVRQYWPKNIGQAISSVELTSGDAIGGIIVDGVATVTDAGVDPANHIWVGTDDVTKK